MHLLIYNTAMQKSRHNELLINLDNETYLGFDDSFHFVLNLISVGVKGLMFVPFDLYFLSGRPLPVMFNLLQLEMPYGVLLVDLCKWVRLDLRTIDFGVCGESNNRRQLSLYSRRRGDATATTGLVIGERVLICFDGGEVHIDSGDTQLDILDRGVVRFSSHPSILLSILLLDILFDGVRRNSKLISNDPSGVQRGVVIETALSTPLSSSNNLTTQESSSTPGDTVPCFTSLYSSGGVQPS